MPKLFRLLLHALITLLLTVLTQIGGLIYLLVILTIKRQQTRFRLKRFVAFAAAYLLVTFVAVPPLAKALRRERIQKTANIQPLTFLTDLANRNYVVPELNEVLRQAAGQFARTTPEAKIQYLDANFPFFDGFPLLPHLSHDDGKKLDLAFVYEKNGQMSTHTPSIFGYGAFESPKSNETNTTARCKNQGYWQYDFTKYLGIGFRQNVQFSEKGTKALIQALLNNDAVGKIFIEPHLKTRMRLQNSRLRFHGCHAVRHDDHIHIQL